MAPLTTTDDCTPANCGCRAHSNTDALAGALRMAGLSPEKDRQVSQERAKTVLWLLREYGWKVVRDE